MVAHTSLSTYGMCLSMCSWIHPVTHSVQLGNATTFGRGFEMRASIFLLLCHLAFHPPTCRSATSFLPSFSLSTAHHCVIPPSDFQASCFLPFFSVISHPSPLHPFFSLCTAHYCVIPSSDLQASHFLPSLCVLLITMLFSRSWQ